MEDKRKGKEAENSSSEEELSRNSDSDSENIEEDELQEESTPSKVEQIESASWNHYHLQNAVESSSPVTGPAKKGTITPVKVGITKPDASHIPGVSIPPVLSTTPSQISRN